VINANNNLDTAYRRFLKEQEPSKKEEAGRDLIRAIFGKDAIAVAQALLPAASRLFGTLP